MSEPWDQPDAAEAATHWLLRREAGEAVERMPEFQAWLDQAEAHRTAWHDARAVWDSFDEEPDLLLTGMRQAALAARPERRAGRGLWWMVGSAAAAAAAVVITVQAGYRARPIAPQAERPQATLAFATAPGDRQDVSLPDGTRVTLDGGTALTAAFYASHREVALTRGQAYFNVVHDPARPFTVRAMGSTITDIGTEFDVLARPQGMQVLLVQGAVAVADGDRRLNLVPGQSYDSSPGARRIERPDALALLAWRNGYIEFTGEPLGQAVAAMNRYAVHPIVVTDPTIASLPSVSGRFKVGDTVHFAEALADLYGLKLVHLPNGAIALRR
jgi:transmembrane sensor